MQSQENLFFNDIEFDDVFDKGYVMMLFIQNIKYLFTRLKNMLINYKS